MKQAFSFSFSKGGKPKISIFVGLRRAKLTTKVKTKYRLAGAWRWYLDTVLSEDYKDQFKACFSKLWVSNYTSSGVRHRDASILLAQTVHNYHKNGVSIRCSIKIGLRQASDSFSWPYVLDLLITTFGSPREVYYMDKSTHYCVSSNGFITGYLHGAKGISQGDALYPTFCADYGNSNSVLKSTVKERKIGYQP